MGHTLKLALWAIAGLAIAQSTAARSADAALLVDAPETLASLERAGLSLPEVIGPKRLDAIREVVAADMREFTAGLPKDSPRRPFQAAWLARGRFELVGVVNRLDRRVFDPTSCGEVRLVYRLALQNPGRPVTRLPMTVNIRLARPRGQDPNRCQRIAEEWARGDDDLVARIPRAGADTKVEINYQSIHVATFRPDMGDSAEYVLRAFDFAGDTLRPAPLFNTPRVDLTPSERRALGAWVRTHLPEIDRAEAVVPARFLATRAVSISPRGLANRDNRTFSRALGGEVPPGFSGEGWARIQSPELLLRRLDELTCAGCHQTRGVAGFHLLGEERDPDATFNALAVGHSPHLSVDLAWRAEDLRALRDGEPPPPRPFAAAPDGRYGSECGLVDGLASWSCRDGLVCRDIYSSDVGVCAPRAGSAPGEPCEDVSIAPSARPEGDVMTAKPSDPTCPTPHRTIRPGPFCAPNWLGFTGGMCSDRCDHPGAITGGSICAPLPTSGYEADCFFGREPIERCVTRHLMTARVAWCDAEHACRDDYGCARVPGAPIGIGACLPPYFIFQARVDGPLLDR